MWVSCQMFKNAHGLIMLLVLVVLVLFALAFPQGVKPRLKAVNLHN